MAISPLFALESRRHICNMGDGKTQSKEPIIFSGGAMRHH
jgi:hypothetical protein